MTDIRLVITDLDNTVYDWIGSFVPALYGMVDVATEILGVPRERLLDDLRTVHQMHGNSEHPFALLETKSVLGALNGIEPRRRFEMLDPAFREFNSIRKRRLHAYDGVHKTLTELRSRGVPVVAYTDARVHNALFRLARLELTDVIVRLYAPQHVAERQRFGDDPEYLRHVPMHYVRELPAEDRKPNPQTLLDICTDFSEPPRAALYVGDSLSRDIFMARSAGLHSAWARYGLGYDPVLWDRLVRVSHWTSDDVAREQRLRIQARGVTPDVELQAFEQLLTMFTFPISARPA